MYTSHVKTARPWRAAQPAPAHLPGTLPHAHGTSEGKALQGPQGTAPVPPGAAAHAAAAVPAVPARAPAAHDLPELWLLRRPRSHQDRVGFCRRRSAGRGPALTMPDVAFLFPGQGSQHAGMGADLLQDPEIAELAGRCAEAAGVDLSRLLTEADDDELRLTTNAQPA